VPNAHRSHFLLVPDRGSARRLRRAIAESGGALAVSVGTWPELIERLRATRLVPPPSTEWDGLLRGALAAMTDAPWHASMTVAPIETTRAISRALRELFDTAFGQDRDAGPDALLNASRKLEGRAGLHLRALAQLWKRLGPALPEDIRIAFHVLSTDANLRIEDVRVVVGSNGRKLTSLQRRLINVLAPDTDDARAHDLQALLERVEKPACSNPKSALSHVSTRLFAEGKSDVVAPDGTIQILAVRDTREEAEVAASMAQAILRAEPGLSLAEIGVLVPADDAYGDAVRDAFTLAGLPLSGMSTGQRLRDFGREYVRHFLSCRQRLAPVMALASFVTLPLAPWPEATGRVMAAMVMNGKFELEHAHDLDKTGREILSLMRTDDESASGLAAALTTLGRHIRSDKSLEASAAAVREAIAIVLKRLPAEGQVDLNDLARLVSPDPQTIDDPAFWQDAMTIFAEDAHPWKQVQHLIVLGASSGRYPTGPFASPVFNEHERREIQRKTELNLPTAEDALINGRVRFLAQLRAARQSLTIFVPERDADGSPLAPSESLVFAARLLGSDLENLILRLSLPIDRAKARFVPVADQPAPVVMPEIAAETFEIGADLLALRKGKDGKPRAQSRSRLETLLVSPLAFVLEELGAVPDEWAPEEAGPALRGTLAHAAFEQLFTPDLPLSDADTIRQRLPSLFEDSVRRLAPFFMGAAWSVERQTLGREIENAAIAWGAFLQSENARMIGREFTLFGSLDGVSVTGRADALIGLANKRFMIVDYKKSGSRKRRRSMEAGFDIQLPLYRLMATSGTMEGLAEDVITAIREGAAVGIAYFMMDDGRALTDLVVDLGVSHPSWRPIETDISAVAMPIVRQRLASLRKGSIDRDTVSWLTQLDKVGNVGLYAIDNSPLIRRFVLDDSLLSGGGDDGES